MSSDDHVFKVNVEVTDTYTVHVTAPTAADAGVNVGDLIRAGQRDRLEHVSTLINRVDIHRVTNAVDPE